MHVVRLLAGLLLLPCAPTLALQQQQVPKEGLKRFRKLAAGRWDNLSLSGPGSRTEVAKPFIHFFEDWLTNHSRDVKSIVEASAGHWPSGWQQDMRWPPLRYTGVDLLPEVVKADRMFRGEQGVGHFGFKTMRFVRADMLVPESLPEADLFFTKDTLIHFPNQYISQFLNQTALVCPPKYKYFMFVHDFRKKDEFNGDITKFGHFHGFDLAKPPFSLPVETVFEWTSDLEVKPHPRLVQVLETSKVCSSGPTSARAP